MENESYGQLPDEVMQQLSTLDRSEFFIYLILFGILISLNVLDRQKKQLICSTLRGEVCECPGLRSDKLISSLIIMAALVFFYRLSAQAVRTSDGTDRSARLNFEASSLTLGASMLRLLDLLEG